MNPKIEVTSIKPSSIKFILSDTDTSVANALRRVMIAEVPTITIDQVEFFDNSSVLTDEFISHRLGLIPLTSKRVLVKTTTEDNMKPMNYKTECSCEGSCDLCTVDFSLHVRNESDETLDVTSRDLVSSDPFVVPVEDFEPVIIVKLKRNQEVRLRAKAVKGVGRTHSKWSPVCTAAFRYDPDIRINPTIWDRMNQQQKQEWVSCCPRNVYALTNDGKLDIKNRDKCIFCDLCVDTAEDLEVEDLVSVKTIPNRFLFKVEATGSLDPKEIITTALEVLGRKLSVVKKGIQGDSMDEETAARHWD